MVVGFISISCWRPLHHLLSPPAPEHALMEQACGAICTDYYGVRSKGVSRLRELNARVSNRCQLNPVNRRHQLHSSGVLLPHCSFGAKNKPETLSQTSCNGYSWVNAFVTSSFHLRLCMISIAGSGRSGGKQNFCSVSDSSMAFTLQELHLCFYFKEPVMCPNYEMGA